MILIVAFAQARSTRCLQVRRFRRLTELDNLGGAGFAVAQEPTSFGMKESWRNDWLLLKRMLHNPKIWFDFLVIKDWHDLFV